MLIKERQIWYGFTWTIFYYAAILNLKNIYGELFLKDEELHYKHF